MKYQPVNSPKGEIAETVFSPGERIADYRMFFDVLMEAPSNTVSIAKENITELFFDLRSGLAGEILQKVSNYRKRLIILGDFTKVESKSLQDFIRESNRTGKVVFVRSLQDAISLLQ